MIRSVTRLLPPTWLVAVAFLFYLLHMAISAYTIWLFEPAWPDFWGYFRQLIEPMVVYLVLVSVSYAAWRVACFHPVFRESYSNWLASTPWSVGRPLPMGPVCLVWQDALVVVPLIGLGALHRPDGPLIVWCWFTVSYVACSALVAALTGHRRWAYLIWFLVFALAPAWHWPLATLALTVVLHLAARGALIASLRTFPWVEYPAVQRVRYSPQARQRKTPVGWPLDRIGPRLPVNLQISAADALAVSGLVAWSFFAAFWPLVRSGVRWNDMESTFIAGALAVGAVIARTAIYFYGGIWPPISFRGRIMTGRLVIPGYDRAFVAPVLMALVAYFALRAIHGPGLAALAEQAGVVFVVIAMGLGLGPRHRDWVLTAPGRIVHAALSDGPLKRI